MQAQRFELKYLISEDKALAVRDFVASFLLLDPYGARQPGNFYPVHSLYLDSDDFALHQSTVNGDKNRFKLRLRFYENRPAAPIYFEIKRRMNNTITKERAPIRRESVGRLLAGQMPAISDLAGGDAQNLVAAQSFVRELSQLGAKPRVHVSYQREAWLPYDGGNSVRVTLDRRVRSCLETTAKFVTDMDHFVSVFGEEVVLELKFTSRFPPWFGDLVRALGLRQTSAAKYVDGLLLMAANETDREPVRREKRAKATSGRFFREINL